MFQNVYKYIFTATAMGNNNKWKIVAIIFIVLFCLISLVALFLFGASYTSYNQMHENACGQSCCAYKYQSFELIENGNCYCTDPEDSSNPFRIEIDRDNKA